MGTKTRPQKLLGPKPSKNVRFVVYHHSCTSVSKNGPFEWVVNRVTMKETRKFATTVISRNNTMNHALPRPINLFTFSSNSPKLFLNISINPSLVNAKRALKSNSVDISPLLGLRELYSTEKIWWRAECNGCLVPASKIA